MSDSNSGKKSDPGLMARLIATTSSTVLAWIIITVVFPIIAFLCLGSCALVLMMIAGALE